ncbi:MAG TPA: protein translocase subunit SecDF [Lachnospiraceae bacterium]|nr:protein translocase subunit SecDF [Lachnospiraceae bacterium]
MKKNQGIAVLILSVLVIALLSFTAAVGWGPTGTGSARNIITGLDLAGGVSITYEADQDLPSASDMSDTIYKLQQRVMTYSEEAKVYQQGTNRIAVEIPGVSDANKILEELGTPGSLYFIKQTDDDGNENYTYDGSVGNYVLNYTIDELKEKGSIVLEGSSVVDAQGGVDQDNTGNNGYVTDLEFDSEGAKAFADATQYAYDNKQTIGIYYDGEFVSVPSVKAVITNGHAVISNMESVEAAQRLATTLRIGSLTLELHEISSSVVGATLGSNAIKTSLTAGAIGLVLVMIFMIVVYALPGFVASLALIIYTGLELVMLNAFDLTLTLPGIAGIILSIGMAVDANVIIYARIREEIGAGKSVRGAITSGFKKAFSAIFDGNITTLIAAAVLGVLGTGSVQGFAMTLALGIVLSMFTALVVSRLIVNALYAVGFRDEKWYGKTVERPSIDFVGKKKLFFTISLILAIGVPVVGMAVGKAATGNTLNFSLEFVGGTSTTVSFNEDMSMERLESEVEPLVEKITGDADVTCVKVMGSNDVTIKTRVLNVDERERMESTMMENFGVAKEGISAQNISATVSNEMRRDAIVAVIVAAIFMLLYIWFRFKNIRFASSAVIALLHDVLVVLGFYAVSRVSVGNTFIACMLTIVGYSINATIVIFDRIRENMVGAGKKDLAVVVNDSITQTLTRSIYTSLTTFVMVAVLWVMGVSSIREFALPIMAGIICGAYSSVCITGSLWYVMTSYGKKAEPVTNNRKKK